MSAPAHAPTVDAPSDLAGALAALRAAQDRYDRRPQDAPLVARGHRAVRDRERLRIVALPHHLGAALVTEGHARLNRNGYSVAP